MIPHCVKVICAKNWLDWMKNNPCTSVFVDVSVRTLVLLFIAESVSLLTYRPLAHSAGLSSAGCLDASGCGAAGRR